MSTINHTDMQLLDAKPINDNSLPRLCVYNYLLITYLFTSLFLFLWYAQKCFLFDYFNDQFHYVQAHHWSI